MKLDWSFMVSFMTKIDKIISLLDSIFKENKLMIAEFDSLTQAITAEGLVINDAVAALNTFNAKLTDLTTQLDAALAQLQTTQADVAALAEVKTQAVALQAEVADKTIALSNALNPAPPAPVA
jgi:hypothetical protein